MTFATPLRAVSTFRAPGLVFGSSAMDHALGTWRSARD